MDSGLHRLIGWMVSEVLWRLDIRERGGCWRLEGEEDVGYERKRERSG